MCILWMGLFHRSACIKMRSFKMGISIDPLVEVFDVKHGGELHPYKGPTWWSQA